ncbi:type II toxin-antitoxin system RelE/ParE family toxin [Chromatocurvus halotolerans]|uniref:Toxin ParE1/3/4 n=1 Tax=Chromatocurvus halotolerans TaxID=1132028 RepID=A0A4R2KMY7_9GAMM|nr:type II toxin-antitoxin system RelE/ParE family toxin [Chromatocurvus halotolerans]TCO75501.1 toxin ParE1/3/4 [Chromatocurvus halotolerans]
MRGYRLTPQAERTLEAIILWTIENFGIDQAESYKNQLINRLSALAADELPHGISCNSLLAGEREVDDLEYYREGRHFIIYRNTKGGLLVLDFIHGSRNLPAILAELG